MTILNTWLLYSKFLFKLKDEHVFLKPGVIHYYVRREVAKKVFKSSYNRLGRFIQVTKEQYNELFEIEEGKLKPNTKRDYELVTKVKEIIQINNEK